MELKAFIVVLTVVQFLKSSQGLNLLPKNLLKLPKLPDLPKILTDFSTIQGIVTGNLTSLLDNVNFDFESKIKKAEEFYKTLSPSILEDAHLLVPELVKKYGYPCESHTVTSPDGYILTMHRIPYGRQGNSQNRPPVYLQHGLLSSSADWLLTGTEKGLGYILADAGYDVWLPNVRGNRYSRKHTKLDPKSSQFWNFSWHEIALFDVSTMIDYVLEKTQQSKLHYIGHSQGTTVFYVLCSEKPEYNNKIKVQLSLAPIGYMNNLVSPLIRLLARVDLGVEVATKLVGANEFLPTTKFSAIVGNLLCSDDSVTQVLCTNTLFALAGFNQKQMNATLLPIIAGHTPAGAATKQILHYTQEIRSGKFETWNGGLFENGKLLNLVESKDYEVEKITAPVYLYYSRNDWLSHEIDVNRLHVRLPNVKEKILISDPKFNHLDYLFAINVRELLYDPMLKVMSAYT